MAIKWPTMTLHMKLALAVSFVQAVVVIALEAAVSYYFINNVNIGSNEQQEGSGKSITVYLFIFIFTQVYQFIMLADAVWNQNTIQIFGHLVYCACMVGFAVFQVFQIHEALQNLGMFQNDQAGYEEKFQLMIPYLVANIVILAVGIFIFAYLAFKLYLEFGWKIYKKIGADPRKRNMYRSYQILIMFLKFALYFFLAYAIQFAVLVLRYSDPEFGLTIFAIFASFFIVYLVAYALRTENKIIMGLWLGFILLILAYFSFKIGRIYDPTQLWKYVGSGKFLTLFASLGLGVTIATFVYSIICLMNFGKGLKDHLMLKQSNAETGAPAENRGGTIGGGRTMMLA